MIRRVCIFLVRVFLLFVFRIKVEGKVNFPEKGGAILALNHRSNWDVVVAGTVSPRRLRFMAKSELFKNKFFGGLISMLGAFPVKRGKGDIGAIKSAMSILKNEEVMLMFPEGRRSTGDNASAKGGVVLISQMANVPVIPAYISGKYKFMHKITVRFGEPVNIPKEGKLTGEEIQQFADDIMKKVRSLKV